MTTSVRCYCRVGLSLAYIHIHRLSSQHIFLLSDYSLPCDNSANMFWSIVTNTIPCEYNPNPGLPVLTTATLLGLHDIASVNSPKGHDISKGLDAIGEAGFGLGEDAIVAVLTRK
jgi:hypothetical protein